MESKYKASESCLRKAFGDLVVQSPKKDVLILRGENSSLSIFVGKYNNVETLKKWVYENNIIPENNCILGECNCQEEK